MADEYDRSLYCVHELAIGVELSDEGICEWQYSVSRALSRRREDLDIVLVCQDSNFVSLVWEQVPEPENSRLRVCPCFDPALEDAMDCNDAMSISILGEENRTEHR